MEGIIELLKSNPAYLAVAVVLAIIILFGAVKKIFKLLLVGLALLVIYLGYMMWSGQEVSVERLTRDIETAKEKVIDGAVEKAKKESEKIINETLK